ncbi:penicillin-binding protein 2 [Patescibacteria group bacterium]|nr:penicillin-binding protein 2 [Patescibacteria group bacterium]MBU4601362.1 penicillin-binding protein 2 [Patescibacteria group bacterium]MCG2697480.1 penicillin-binding protein 2 [Candidatus Parcubacteria bacterium]
MNSWRRKEKNNTINQYNNRIYLIMALVFLLGFLMLYRLFNLQAVDYDFYKAQASGQHGISSILEPDRGSIYIKDSAENSEGKIYPMATNKEFALVYAIPKEVVDAENLAEQIYLIFDQSRTEKEADELLMELQEQGEVLDEKFKPIKKEAEMNLRKDVIIKKYLEILSKKNDPYEPIADKVGGEALEKIKQLDMPGIGYIMKKYRFYPEDNIGSHILGFVGYVGDDKRGRYGIEGFFDEELYGKFGSINAERSASGGVVIINDRKYNKPQNGSDFVLTINRPIQFMACDKLNEAALRYGAEGGSIIIMDPKNGAILAMCSWPDYDPNDYKDVENISVYNNPAIFSEYEPGSIFKSITMAAAIDQDKVSPETTYNDEGMLTIDGWPIKNSDYESYGGHGIVDMNTVLVASLNTGAIYAMEQTGAKVFADYVKKFNFGEKTGIELETEGGGNISSLTRSDIREVEAATASFGQGITVTPLQIISAYGAIANNGILMKPYLVQEIINYDGSKIITKPRQIRQVISPRSSLLVSAMLVNVVDSGHAKLASVNGYYVAGKTGTAQVADIEKRGYGSKTIHSFVGFAPVEDPKFVMLVKLDNPKSAQYAASTAAPLFGEIAEFILNYYQVPRER